MHRARAERAWTFFNVGEDGEQGVGTKRRVAARQRVRQVSFGGFGAPDGGKEATCSDSIRSSSISTQLSGSSDMGYSSIEYNAAPSTGHFDVAPKHPNTHTNTQITTRPDAYRVHTLTIDEFSAERQC